MDRLKNRRRPRRTTEPGRSPCWTLFYENNKRRTSEKCEKKPKNLRKTPSYYNDLPSSSVKSLGGCKWNTLSNPIPAAYLEWNQCYNNEPKTLNREESKTETTSTNTEKSSTSTSSPQQTPNIKEGFDQREKAATSVGYTN
ncbi:hypothetical protein BLOT_002906 [Blomia tropicalis]|nr:hypothetical protein BLOT_002906 [Blomia tropicalis]